LGKTLTGLEHGKIILIFFLDQSFGAPPPSLESPQTKRVAMKKFIVTLQIFFSHPSLVIYFFATPPTKFKLGQQIRGGLLTTNHLDQLLRWAIKKH
jgi:hypothetical protein